MQWASRSRPGLRQRRSRPLHYPFGEKAHALMFPVILPPYTPISERDCSRGFLLLVRGTQTLIDRESCLGVFRTVTDKKQRKSTEASSQGWVERPEMPDALIYMRYVRHYNLISALAQTKRKLPEFPSRPQVKLVWEGINSSPLWTFFPSG